MRSTITPTYRSRLICEDALKNVSKPVHTHCNPVSDSICVACHTWIIFFLQWLTHSNPLPITWGRTWDFTHRQLIGSGFDRFNRLSDVRPSHRNCLLQDGCQTTVSHHLHITKEEVRQTGSTLQFRPPTHTCRSLRDIRRSSGSTTGYILSRACWEM